ncbi:type IV pilin biogenesis protein [Acidithiobacillus caldus]|uniref:type IV pilin biogenesis protein n=2 Tax=Acidithiobacillus caldus TaxID=33059 RepID=UPI001C06C4D5|nr:type IV pilin biogenesis protein [Acidithiobacillus caldus]MBU2802267.1 type IV pilin biogenesis protein [Acidithiobacillus caldus]
MSKLSRKILSAVLAVGLNLLPLQGLIPEAQAAGGLNIPPKDQPQVLIILDNSQGMAGVLQGSNGLSGAIMTGSGTVANNTSSSSPTAYTVSNFVPPAYPKTPVSNGASVPYTVACGSSGLTAAAQSACTTIGNGGYVDNSPSMLNAAESAVRGIVSNPIYAGNIQFGLATYQTSGSIQQFNTWVYYMSANNGFSFGNSATAPIGLIAVPNPCYGSVSGDYFTRNSCANIYFNQNLPNISYNSQLYQSPYLYIQDTSDNPIINDVLYANGFGSGNENSAAAYPYPYNLGNLQAYMQQNTGVNYRAYSTPLSSGMTPTSAGYVPQSFEIWEAQRGFGFNAPTVPNAGRIVVPITRSNSNNAAAILDATVPEVFFKSGGSLPSNAPISAAAGYSPVAGAFTTALQYLSGQTRNPPPTTCGKKYVIFITDGQPTQGLGGNVYPPLGSAAAGIFGVTSITASTWSSTNNRAVTEAIQAVQNLQSQGINTYVLGVGSAVNPNIPGTTAAQQAEAQQGSYVLQAMAQAGGTQNYYSATTQADVQSALNNIIANILGKSVVSSYAAPPTVTVGSLEFQLKNINPVTGQGDLFAYPLTANGSLSTTPAWTANGIMSQSNRQSALYTTPVGAATNHGGSPQTLAAVAATDSAAFAITNTKLSAATVASYTINPSFNSGQYLGGRASGWFLGLPSSAPAVVLTPPANAGLLSNGGSYLTYAANHSARQNAVLFSDNDGFLYALGYNQTGNPTLLWAWMPGYLLPSLQNYNTFWQGNNMGPFATIDASPDGGKNWHTYVVGSATANGFVVYDLQLKGTSAPNLGSVVAQYQQTGYSQTLSSPPVFYQVQNAGQSNYGATWAIYALSGSSGSALGILNATTGTWMVDPLPFTNTATPYIDSSGNLFLGDANGNVYEMSAANLQTLLAQKKDTSIPLSSSGFVAIGNYAPWSSGSLSAAVQYIGGTIYQGFNYLRVQGANGITVFKQSNGVWSPVWTSYTGGAGTWSGGTLTPSTGGPNGVSALPSGSAITDQALLVGGQVIVPVTVPPASSDTCGVSLAEYYVFHLTSGVFPSGSFVSTSGAPITQGFVVGQGTAYRPSLTVFNGRVLLQGGAARNRTGGTTGFPGILGGGLPAGGPMAWRLTLSP